MCEMESCVQKIDYPKVVEIIDKNTNDVVGEVLTFLEAVVPEERRVEAAKSTIKQMLWRFNKNVKYTLSELLNSSKKTTE
jgi:uncharacterized FlaG/YvyC family protein